LLLTFLQFDAVDFGRLLAERAVEAGFNEGGESAGSIEDPLEHGPNRRRQPAHAFFDAVRRFDTEPDAQSARLGATSTASRGHANPLDVRRHAHTEM